MKKHSLMALGLLSLGIVASGSASAGFFTSHQVKNFVNDNPGDTGIAGTTLSFNGFDSSLGNLIGVYMQITNVTETLQASVFKTNRGAGTYGNVAATSTTTLSITGFPSLSATFTLATTPASGTVAGLTTNTTTLVGTQVSVSSAAGTQSFITGNNTTLASFIGGVNLFDVIASSETPVSGTKQFSTMFLGSTGDLSGQAELWYEYSRPAPEPGTLSLISLGVIGFAAARKRKSA